MINRRTLLKSATAIVLGAKALLSKPQPTKEFNASDTTHSFDNIDEKGLEDLHNLTHQESQNTFKELREFAATPIVRRYVEQRKDAVMLSRDVLLAILHSPLVIGEQFVRMALEDMIVLDAVAVYKGKSKIPYLLDAANVLLYASISRQYPPTSPAFHVVGSFLPGLVFIRHGSISYDLTSDELLYFKRNNTGSFYGYSEVDRWLDARKSYHYFFVWPPNKGTEGDIAWTLDFIKKLNAWYD